MPFLYTIPAFFALMLLLALPFFSGREYRLVLKLLFGLVVLLVPLLVAAYLADDAQSFLRIWVLVLLAPFIWLVEHFAGPLASGAAPPAGGATEALLPWLPVLALLVIAVMVVTLKGLHRRAKRRPPPGI